MAEKKQKKKKTVKIDNLNLGINEFGEMTTNINLDEINKFLNENVDDKKLNDKKNKSNDD
jgi:hypothetical protein